MKTSNLHLILISKAIFNFISFALYGGKNLGVSKCNAI